MEESTTYQEIIEQGVEKGRRLEARDVLLRWGTKRLGPPTPETKARIEAVSDIQQLENLTDLLDGSVKDWAELLRSLG